MNNVWNYGDDFGYFAVSASNDSIITQGVFTDQTKNNGLVAHMAYFTNSAENTGEVAVAI